MAKKITPPPAETTTPAPTAIAKKKPAAKKKPLFARGVRKEAAALVVAPPVVAPPAPTIPDRVISGEDIQLGQLGLVAPELTPEQETKLSRPAPVEWLRVKPNGAVYVSHPQLTALMNDTFGRFKWALLPASRPALSESGNGRKQVTAFYVLHINGQPVASAVGEQDYSDKNPEQSYGDAAEGTVASALRRCLKRIGVFPELWDRDYTAKFLREHCTQVQVKDWSGKIKDQWRLKSSEPLKGELAHRSEQKGENRYAPGTVAPPGAHDADTEPITRQQQQRLFTILKGKARTEADLKAYLETKYRIQSTGDIQRRDYDTVIRWIEAPVNAVKQLPAGDTPRADDIDWGAFTVDGLEPGQEG